MYWIHNLWPINILYILLKICLLILYRVNVLIPSGLSGLNIWSKLLILMGKLRNISALIVRVAGFLIILALTIYRSLRRDYILHKVFIIIFLRCTALSWDILLIFLGKRWILRIWFVALTRCLLNPSYKYLKYYNLHRN